MPVSYTHLDVYKRQENGWLRLLDPTLYCLITVCEAVCSVILITALAQTARNRSLKRRSKARKALQTIVICMTAGACFLSGLLLSLRIGAFSEQAVLNQIEKTSWYQTVYDDMKRETFRTLSLIQVPEYDYGDTVCLLYTSYIIFCYVPMYGVTIAFKDFNPMKGIMRSSWVGFETFQKLFSMEKFYSVFRCV